MIDVIYTLTNIMPTPLFGGCIDYERPVLNEDGSGTGQFVPVSDEDIKAQYDALRWEDSRPKPTWDELVAFAQANPPIPPLLDRLAAIVDQLSDDVQAQFGGVIAPAYVALQNNKPNVAKIMIQNLTVPDSLTSVKMALLAEFER